MAGNLQDYPADPGNKRWSIATVAGPSSYTAITPGSPPVGGQVVKAVDIGLIDFDFVFPSASDDGQYLVYPIFDLNPQRAVTQVRLIWVTAATGAQVGGGVNLSARTVRICGFGN